MMTEATPSLTMEGDCKVQRGRPRHLLVLTINYSPEPTGFAPHVTAFCEHLARAGFRVTVLTGFPFAPQWRRWSEYKGRFLRTELQRGVRVVRHTHFIPRSPRRLIERVLMEGSFCLSACISLARHLLSADAIVYVGAQPSISMLARVAATLRRVPYGVMINDLAAGAAVNVGILKPTLFSRMLHAFEFTSYLGATRAMVLCQSFKDALGAAGYSRERIDIVRSPVDIEQVRPADVNVEFRRRHNLSKHDFVILFAGSMGLKQGLSNVVAAAGLVAPERDMKWVLVGEGETRADVERQIRAVGLESRVLLLPFQPENQLTAMLSSADVLLLNQLASVKDTVIPSKLLTYMAAGRPVLAAVNSHSQAAELLRESGGGIVVEPESAKALAKAAEAIQDDARSRAEMGAANRRYAVEHFDQRKIMAKLQKFVEGLFTSLPAGRV